MLNDFNFIDSEVILARSKLNYPIFIIKMY
jgi:hypothetical protein